MTNKEIRSEIKNALIYLAKVKKKLTPNEYADIYSTLLIIRGAVED